jgi:hypothetical protein
MNTIPLVYRFAAILCIAAFSTGCMTTYDSYGRPVQTVDPALAVAGIAAAGIIGYAIANNNDDTPHYNSGYRSRHRSSSYDSCGRSSYYPHRSSHYYY